MSFVQFSKVSLAFGDRDILKNVSVNLSEGSKAALAGVNGSGKSTLMKVMAGFIPPDSGDRAIQKDTRVAYLPQSGIVHHGTSLRQEADRAFHYGYELHVEMEKIGDELAAESGLSESKQKQLLLRHHEISEYLEESGWHRRDALAEQILIGLGFCREDLDRDCSEFSGGWQMRIALAKSLLENPDILLLDEPTNYLDIEARGWLEQFLEDFQGGFLLVSHDRYFLDVTINEVYELFDGDLKHYSGNYSEYERQRQVELDTLIARYQMQQEEIKKLEDFINRFGAKATKAAQAQERQKMLDKILLDKIEIPESLKKIHFSFPPAPHSGRLVVTTEAITKTYPLEQGENHVLQNVDLVVEKGERLVVAGRNGAGKTTLLRIIAGQDSNYQGNVKLGAGVSIGYFSQDNAEKMKGSMSILEMFENEAPLELIPKIRDMLGAFLFRGDDVYKSIDVLSGGEKSRLALLQILLRSVNLLILDEPTNHLDLHSKDVLLDALKDYGGTVIFVSHDRGFIENLATRVLELSHDKDRNTTRARNFPGTYSYYLDRLAQEEQGLVPTENNQAKQTEVPVQVSSGALSYEEEKRLKAEKKKQEKEEQRLLDEISKAEEEKAQLEDKMSDPQVYSDGIKSKEVQKKITEMETKILELTEQWEKLNS